RNRDESGVRSWCIEIHCGESQQLDYRSWSDDKDEGELDWLASAEPTLYAQMLPLPVDSPDELVGQTYSFPQSPDDEPADWERAVAWLFCRLYMFGRGRACPRTVTFTERQEQRYRVKIGGCYAIDERQYELRVEAWLDWVE